MARSERRPVAISAGAATFGAGLLEAALFAHGESAPVLLAAYDVAAVGSLQDAIACRSRFAAALVLAPRSARAHARLRLRAHASAPELAPSATLLQASHRDNPAARSLPLLAALARRESGVLQVAAGSSAGLEVEISF